tara:strand:- start:3534 stop:4562 length:1029 start_codon:yes stop_codon:yes gene_type:complete
MDNDYNRALSGYSQQLQELGGYAEQKTAQIGQYNDQVKSAVSSYKKLAEGKTTNEFLSALTREGSAAGIRYLKQQLTKTDAAGKLTGKLGQGVGKVEKVLGKGQGKLQSAGRKITNLGRRLGGKAEKDTIKSTTELDDDAPEIGDVVGEADKAAESIADDDAPEIADVATDADLAAEGAGMSDTAFQGAFNADADLTAAQDAAQAALTGSADVEITGADAVINFGEEAAGSVAGDVAGDVAGGALETLGAVTEGAGDVLDATGVGAVLGIGLNIAGAAEGIYGAYEGGKGIYDFVKDDILGKGVEAAKESVAKVQAAVTNVGNSIAIPTFDTAMNIHSSGAW